MDNNKWWSQTKAKKLINFLIWSFTIQRLQTFSKTSVQDQLLLPCMQPHIAIKNSTTLGLPAQDAIFIFFASLTGLFKSSVFHIFSKCNLCFWQLWRRFIYPSTRKKIKLFTSSVFNEVREIKTPAFNKQISGLFI